MGRKRSPRKITSISDEDSFDFFVFFAVATWTDGFIGASASLDEWPEEDSFDLSVTFFVGATSFLTGALSSGSKYR